MSIKLIAVDMDGTFLSDQKTYNRDRFMAQYQQMKQQGIRFVVASGNQYYQLISFFPEIAHEIAFVAENGGWVVSEGEDVFNGELTKADFQTVVEHLLTRADVEIIACGKNSAYTLKQYDEALKAVAAMYYHRLEFVDNFNNINDVFFKFGLNITDERIPEVQAALHDAIGDIMVPVHTGYGSIDLIIPGVHKANGLRLLQQRWGIEIMKWWYSATAATILRCCVRPGLVLRCRTPAKPLRRRRNTAPDRTTRKACWISSTAY